VWLGRRICGIDSSIIKSQHASPGSVGDAQLWLKIKAHGLREPIWLSTKRTLSLDRLMQGCMFDLAVGYVKIKTPHKRRLQAWGELLLHSITDLGRIRARRNAVCMGNET
jgi:hypothetical protein